MTNDIAPLSSILSEQELQQAIGENFTAAKVEQVPASTEIVHPDLWFQRPITLENSIALSQFIQSYSPRSGLFDNVDVGISIQERSWGTGSWSAVEDGNLLWAQNEYRLMPAVSNMPTGYGVYSSSFSYRTYDAQGNAGSWQSLTQEPYYSGTYQFLPNSAFINDGSSAMGKMDFRMTVVFASYATGNPAHVTTYITEDSYFRSSLNVSWSAVDGSTNAIQLGENPSANGGGQRCIPEKALPTGSVNDTINVQINISPAIPEGYSGDIWLRLFDPDNALALDQNDALASSANDQTYMPIDNYGNALLYSSNLQQVQISVSSSQSTLSIPLTISDAHAGDNYIVAAHPDEAGISEYRLNPTDGVTVERPSGNPDDPDSTYTYENVIKTPQLTVWRTLNVECDRMVYFNNPSNPDDGTLPLNPADYLSGVVSAEFAKTCVVIHDRTPANNTNPDSAWTTYDDDENPEWNGISSEDVERGRDFPASQNSDEFWSIRIVSMPVENNGVNASSIAGRFRSHTNTITLYDYAILSIVTEWDITSNENLSVEEFASYNEQLFQKALLHEMGHAFGLSDGAAVLFPENGNIPISYIQNGNNYYLANNSPPNMNHVDVMNTMLFYKENIYGTPVPGFGIPLATRVDLEREVGVYRRFANTSVTPHMNIIQSQSKVVQPQTED